MDGIESCSFADLITNDPKGKGIGDHLVFTNATNEAVVLSNGVERDRVEAFCGIIAKVNALGFSKDGLGLGNSGGFFKNRGDGDGVRAHDGNTHAGAGHFEVREIENLTAFVEHFLFFLGVAAVLEDIDMRNDVMRDLMRVDFFFDRGV